MMLSASFLQRFNGSSSSSADRGESNNKLSHSKPCRPIQLSDFQDETSSSLPPLDQITVCSTACDDDNSSLSSMSSAGHCAQDVKPRTLFKSYWETSGSFRSLKSVSVPVKELSFTSPEVDTTVAITYEHTLELREISVPRTESTPRTRRRIFGQLVCSDSLPLFPSLNLHKDLREIRSASALTHKKPKESCLRQSRFSGQRRRDSDASDASVSFSATVDVVFFEPPSEQWAPAGWSDRFV